MYQAQTDAVPSFETFHKTCVLLNLLLVAGRKDNALKQAIP